MIDITIVIASTLGALILLGGLSAGSALGLHLVRPAWSRAKRIFSAAGFAALLPMSIAFAGFFLEGDVDDVSEFVLALLALTIATLVIAILCLPSAWMLTRHAEAKDRRPVGLIDADEDPVRIGVEG